MSAVLLAVFNDYESAERAHLALFHDGFPADRIELTASRDLGRAEVEPATSPHEKCVQYFRTLLPREDERKYPEMLAQRVDEGAAVVTVLPRGAIETERAAELLKQARPAEVIGHDLEKHGWERASAKHEGYWVQHVWLEKSPETDCLYCRLFPGRAHEH